jgi:ADP-ribose pyrophosphatase
MTIFLATELTAGEATPMEDERIQSRWFPARLVEKMILSNKIQDAKTMIGYFAWKNGKR